MKGDHVLFFIHLAICIGSETRNQTMCKGAAEVIISSKAEVKGLDMRQYYCGMWKVVSNVKVSDIFLLN